MKKRISVSLFRIVKWLIWLFYPKIQVVGAENLPGEPAVIVGNHCLMNGPICAEIHFPVERYTWCVGEMMHLKEVPGYAFEDFWSRKPRRSRWFYRLLSYIIAPLSVLLFNNANTIPVYRDMRMMSTFRSSIARMQEGASIVIFPEHDQKHNHIVHQFQEGFVNIAQLYYKKTGRELSFVPLYIAPRLKKMFLGKPIRYCAANPMDQERRRICDYLMNEITQIAVSLPRHRVVPYRNIPRKHYPYNIPVEVTSNEKTGC